MRWTGHVARMGDERKLYKVENYLLKHESKLAARIWGTLYNQSKLFFDTQIYFINFYIKFINVGPSLQSLFVLQLLSSRNQSDVIVKITNEGNYLMQL
jgi:hypothetical protein